MATMSLSISLPVEFTTEGDVIVASCDEIGVYSQGCTGEEAKRNIVEAINLFLITCFEMGTLSDVLKDCGFRPNLGGQYCDINGREHVDVVLPFIAAKQMRECRA